MMTSTANKSRIHRTFCGHWITTLVFSLVGAAAEPTNAAEMLEVGKCYSREKAYSIMKQDGVEMLFVGNRHHLSDDQIRILGKQVIRTTKDGKKITALSHVRALDRMLDDWDNTFADMVAQGIANPGDSDKVREGYEGTDSADASGILNANIFFSNSKGYGYTLEGDQPLGSKSQKICVGATYRNVHLNSEDNPQIPDWAKSIKPDDGGPSFQESYKNGVRLVFGAQSYKRDKEGKETDGKAIFVTVSTNRRARVWAVSFSSGEAHEVFSMRNFGVSQYMADVLNGVK